ncbi:phosphoribosylamine--glycine ligase, partial [Lactobacillus nasalidis]
MKDKLKILVIGSGGREFAVARALKKSPHVAEVFCAPGNSGMASIGVKALGIPEDDFKALKDFAIKEEIAWTFVGPEDALVAGIVDYFHAFDLKIFGPNARAAQLEGSKDYALQFMEKYQVPHPRYETFQTAEAAIAALPDFGSPVVLKEDGLAGGKGVVIAESRETAAATLREMFAKGQKQVVLEEFLTGPEYSVFAVMQNGNYRLLPLAQDHKRAYDDDKGPNTGGMGSYSPVPQLSPEQYQAIVDQLVKPTAKGLEAGGYDYHGVLYL